MLKKLHHPATAKRVIYLFMSGGPSQMDLFDYKPLLNKLHGQQLPESVRKGQRLTGDDRATRRSLPLVGSPFKFEQHGKSGAWVSELLPHTAKIADELCFIKSMHTEAINHDPAVTFMQTGSQIRRPAQHRGVAQLRPGERERQPAGVRGAASPRTRTGQPLVLAAVGQRLPAVAASGRAVPRRRRTRCCI